MFEIYLSNAALKALKEYDIKKVEGADDIYRIRISRHRIVYRIDWSKKEINIIKIDKRNEKTYCL